RCFSAGIVRFSRPPTRSVRYCDRLGHPVPLPISMPTDTPSLDAEIERWRAARLQRLTAPDGCLTLVGLPWLEPGDNRIGSAADNAIVVEGLPAHLGIVRLGHDGEVAIALAGDSEARIDG